MKSFALSSGSSGNCFYIESNSGVKVLVDLGLSYAKTKEILIRRKVDIDKIDAVFITHEHSDHVLGFNTFFKNSKCNIYMSKGTRTALKVDDSRIKEVKHHSTFSIQDMKVFVLEKPHDANEAISFVFDDGRKLGIFTDLGHISNEIKHTLKTLDVVYIEANYCKDYVENNKHKFNFTYLNRLMSDLGHLGLHQTSEALVETSHDNQKIVLSHISENTNSYENTYETIRKVLEEVSKFPELVISFQGEPTEWIE